MRITVWHYCKVVETIDIPDAPGPDIGLDPWNDLIGTESNKGHEIPVHYHAGLDH